MTKKNIIKAFVPLLFSSFLAKCFSLLSKIALTNTLGLEAMSIFGLINPLLVLIITLASFSLPNVLSYFIATHPQKGRSYFKVAAFFIIINGLLLSLILYFSAPFIGNTLLHNENVIISIRTLCFLIPLISVSSVIKGYFLGCREVFLTTSSQLFEEGSRLIFNLFIVNFLFTSSSSHDAALAVISLGVGEIFQTIYLLIFSDKKYLKRYKNIFKPTQENIKKTSFEMMKIALPMTLSRIVGSLTYFLEPIIIMNLLVSLSNVDSLTYQYGILASYVMPLLLMPGFFSLALSNYLLPNMSYHLGQNEVNKAFKLFKHIVITCTLIGLLFSIIFFFFGDNLLQLLYNTSDGSREIRLLSIPFFIYYIETPFATALNALKKTTQSFISTVISSIIRIILLVVLTRHLGVFAVCIATLISCFINVIFNGINIYKSFLFYKTKSHI